MDNVIPFPKNNKIPVDEDEVDDKIAQVKYHHINETLQIVIPIMFSYKKPLLELLLVKGLH